MAISVKAVLKHWMTSHVQGEHSNIFIFSTPRSGSSWLAELIASQGRFKIVNEPFNLRKEVVRETLGLETWESLLEPNNRPMLKKYLEHFVAGTDNDYRFFRERPFSRFWHARTDRIIFKILFAGENYIPWFKDEFSAHVVLLIRHPLAVSLSRTSLPRLESFLSEPFAQSFTEKQLAYARVVIDRGDRLELAVLDWCLQNAVPLSDIGKCGLAIFYEELVMHPERVVSRLGRELGLPNSERMLHLINKASRSTGLSRKEYRDVLLNEKEMRDKRRWLIERWRTKVDAAEEARAFETLEMFGIDCYERGRVMPADRYLGFQSASYRN